MTLISPLSVEIVKPETAFAETMTGIRTWLDHQKIEPAEFKTLAAGGKNLTFQIRFQREDEAVLFERAFA